ncbi:MAG TPA: hypothetical protein VF158_06235 [Longimicrobiales bacterium]
MRAPGSRPLRRATTLLALVAAACAAPRAEEAEPGIERPTGWRVDVAEHIGLWYHGLAYVRAADGEGNGPAVPRYAPAYVDSIVRLKRRLGIYPTVLDTTPEALRTELRGESYDGLEFLPLYFQDTAALFSSIEEWEATGGDPRRAGSAAAARVVAFLSSLFPRARQRDAVVAFADALRRERETFYAAYWQERLPTLRARSADVQREWDALAPALRDYLDYAQLENGELFLVPALGAEGRLVRRGLPFPRAAEMVPPAARPADAVLAFVHEMTYPIAQDAVRDYVAPARLRELGEERLVSRAAVRAGAMLLDGVAPDRTAAYQRLYLRAVGREAEDGTLEAEFREAFPLPAELERGLRQVIDRALAGI